MSLIVILEVSHKNVFLSMFDILHATKPHADVLTKMSQMLVHCHNCEYAFQQVTESRDFDINDTLKTTVQGFHSSRD